MAAYSLFSGKDLKIYFFIGRLNPPHEGHVAALKYVIQRANDDGSNPLILLGSGPKGERTLDNPVPFETKAEFLHDLFRPQGLQFTIRRMTSALPDLQQWYTDVLSHYPHASSVEFIRVAGDKDDNASKFDYLIRPLSALGPNVSLSTLALPPIKSGNSNSDMSATIVRKDAYRCFISDKGEGGFQQFASKYGHFYGPYTGQIYKDICFPASFMSDLKIQEYIHPTKTKSKTKTKTKSTPTSKTKKNKP